MTKPFQPARIVGGSIVAENTPFAFEELSRGRARARILLAGEALVTKPFQPTRFVDGRSLHPVHALLFTPLHVHGARRSRVSIDLRIELGASFSPARLS